MEGHITLAAEKLFSIGPLPITNTILTTWLVTAVMVSFAFVATRKVALVPNSIQNFAEFAVESLHDLVESVAGTKTAVFFPIIASFFFFIIVGNYLGLLPGFGTIGVHQGSKFVPLFRSINSDLNTTLALALVSVIATHYLAIKYLGLGGYLKKWFSLNPIFLFVGIIELAGEFTKVVSLSFRLFGNIFAGETALTTVSKLFAFIVPIPFMLLEIIVGFVQALVFAMLTLVFMVILTQKHEH
ncbi:MAG: F0F1 ATP synthase subunit A [Candidatus Curtissbacteria bacterium]|nr:F0F1 ATP synthase subunit A [Candidatus Curtissbacteria bacterium]